MLEVSISENTYFVNKLYIVIYVFLHRHFSYALEFWYIFRKIHLFNNEEKKKKVSGSLPGLYNAIHLYVEAEASHESCTENL